MEQVFDPKDLPLGTPFHLDTRGSSMQNFIKQGDVLFAQRADPKDLAIGDIVVFKYVNNDDFITHRLLFRKKEKGDTLYIFKGDGLKNLDKPVSGENVIGKVLVIDRAGKRIELNTIRGRLINGFFFLVSLCGLSWRRVSYAFTKNRLFRKPFRAGFFMELRRKLKLRTRLQSFVIKTGKNKILNRAYRAYYILAIKSFKAIFSHFKEIESIYLRRQVARGSWQPGASDIDLSVIIKEMPYERDARFLKAFWRDYARLRKIFPFLGEVEIATRRELENWQRAWGVRAQEVVYWRRIYGREKALKLQPALGPDTVSLNYLSESLQSFWALSLNVTAKRESDVLPHEFRKFFNLVVDILKFIEKTNRDVPDERQKFIFNFIAGHKESMFGQELKRFAGKIFNNGSRIENDLLISVYSHIIRYLDENCEAIYKKLLSYENGGFEDYFLTKHISQKVDINEGGNDGLWKEFVDKIAKVCGNNITSILSNSHVFTDHSFVVLKEGLNTDVIKDTCRKILDILRHRDLAIVTGRILQCISCSLFMESSFNYWHLVEQARVDFGVDPKGYLRKPPDYITFGLFNKSIGQFNLYFRRFPVNRVPVYLLYHSIDHIMRLRLAMEKRIVVCSLADAINEYKIHFREAQKTSAD